MPDLAYFRSRELRFLIALLRGAVGTESVPPNADGVSWPEFARLVQRHRVSAFLHQRLPDHMRALLPAPVVERLRNASQLTVQRALRQAGIQRRLVGALDRSGIEVVAVKGLVLSQQRYGAIGARHVGDIDLLVPAHAAAAADAILQSEGLLRTRPDFPLTQRQSREYLRLKPEFEYCDAQTNTRVELLWRLEGIPQAAASPRLQSNSCRIGNHDYRTLPPEIEAIYLLQHGARHGWFRLFWVLDAAALFRDPSMDWNAVISLARGIRGERAVLQAADLVERLLAIAPPLELAAATREQRTVRALTRHALRQIEQPVPGHEPVAEWVRQLGYRMCLHRGLRAKAHVLAPHVLTPETWRFVRLPDRWFALYIPLTPFLWLWRRCNRRTGVPRLGALPLDDPSPGQHPAAPARPQDQGQTGQPRPDRHV